LHLNQKFHFILFAQNNSRAKKKKEREKKKRRKKQKQPKERNMLLTQAEVRLAKREMTGR
jgi:hypothetical protein